MKKFGLWLYDALCGLFICTGISMCLCLIIYSIFKVPEINFKNTLFLIEFIALFWLLNFIFHFTSPLIIKGTLHSIICFMLSIIVFSINFGYVPAARMLLMLMLIFFSVYWLFLWGFVRLSKKVNSPLRHFPEWLFRLRPQSTAKTFERE